MQKLIYSTNLNYFAKEGHNSQFAKNHFRCLKVKPYKLGIKKANYKKYSFFEKYLQKYSKYRKITKRKKIWCE